MNFRTKTLILSLIFFLPIAFSSAIADSSTEALDRLRPIDTSSPQAVYVSLHRGLQQGMKIFYQGNKGALRQHTQRLIRIFDFSETPPVLISQQGPEHFWQLVDIMDRLPKIEIKDIPDEEQMRTEGITRWAHPNTELIIHKVTEGPRAGEFLITPETFRRLPEFYTKVADLPKRKDAIFPMEAYKLYRNGMGTSFPTAVLSKLPETLKQDWLGQPGWKWLALITTLVLVMLLARPLFLLRPIHVDEPRDDDLGLGVTLRRIALPVYILIAMQALEYLLTRQLRLTGMGLSISQITAQLTMLLATAYILKLLIALLAEVVIKILHTRRASFDSQLIRLSFRILFWVISLMVIAIISEHIGVPVAALAAGLGVGGLAFALASQSTLENLVAGLTIYGDRPIRIGDFCTIGSATGTVESIGLRSTRLRTLERTLITIPNAEVAKHTLENFAARDRMLLETVLSLRYETTPDQLRYVLGKLRELFYAHPKVIDDGMRVRFVGFGASSLDIEIYVYVQATAKPAYLEICEDLNLRIMNIINEAGAAFAFPSQTAYLTRDTAADPERVLAAESRVEAWRKDGELPFPDLSDQAQDAVADQLDYPPLGSPGNKHNNN